MDELTKRLCKLSKQILEQYSKDLEKTTKKENNAFVKKWMKNMGETKRGVK